MKAYTTAVALLASAGSALGALTQVSDFGTNPTNLQMYISVPAKVATSPAVIVAVCHKVKSLWIVADSEPSFTLAADPPLDGIAARSFRLNPNSWASS